MDVLEDTIELLNDRGLHDMSANMKLVQEAIQSALRITRFGDVLFADELRNLLNRRHNIPARRGGPTDPMLSIRLRRTDRPQ